MGGAAALVFPSIWYEGLSRVVIEAYSKGTPIIASDVGPASTIVKDGQNGVLFKVGDWGDLAGKLSAFPAVGEGLDGLRLSARQEYERCYSDDVVYRDLMKIYYSAIARRSH
jgi:glycosyltransferase involved in cell wall biosynthesis